MHVCLAPPYVVMYTPCAPHTAKCTHTAGDSCATTCKKPVTPINATYYPGPSTDSRLVWDLLFNGKTTYYASTLADADGLYAGLSASTAATATNPHIQLELDSAYTNIEAVGLWPSDDSSAGMALSRNMTVILSPTVDFENDPGSVVCEAGIVALLQSTQRIVRCPTPTPVGMRYVTLKRYSSSPAALQLQEARIYLSE